MRNDEAKTFKSVLKVNWSKFHTVFRCFFFPGCFETDDHSHTAAALKGPTHSSKCGWWRRFTGDLPRSPESSAGIVTRKFRHPKFEGCWSDVGKQTTERCGQDELRANSERYIPTTAYSELVLLHVATRQRWRRQESWSLTTIVVALVSSPAPRQRTASDVMSTCQRLVTSYTLPNAGKHHVTTPAMFRPGRGYHGGAVGHGHWPGNRRPHGELCVSGTGMTGENDWKWLKMDEAIQSDFITMVSVFHTSVFSQSCMILLELSHKPQGFWASEEHRICSLSSCLGCCISRSRGGQSGRCGLWGWGREILSTSHLGWSFDEYFDRFDPFETPKSGICKKMFWKICSTEGLGFCV